MFLLLIFQNKQGVVKNIGPSTTGILETCISTELVKNQQESPHACLFGCGVDIV